MIAVRWILALLLWLFACSACGGGDFQGTAQASGTIGEAGAPGAEFACPPSPYTLIPGCSPPYQVCAPAAELCTIPYLVCAWPKLDLNPENINWPSVNNCECQPDGAWGCWATHA